jgi:hypothetical protein
MNKEILNQGRNETSVITDLCLTCPLQIM